MIAADLQSVQVWLATTSVDMRKSFDGLAEVVRSFLGYDPLSGSLFVFRNKGGPPGQSAVVGPGRAGDLLQTAGAGRVPLATEQPSRRRDHVRPTAAIALGLGSFEASGVTAVAQEFVDW